MTSSKSKFEGVKAPLHMTAHLMPGFVVQEHENLLAEKSKELATLLLAKDPTELYAWLGSNEKFSKYLDRNSVVQRFMDKGWLTNGVDLSLRGIGYFFPEQYATLVKS